MISWVERCEEPCPGREGKILPGSLQEEPTPAEAVKIVTLHPKMIFYRPFPWNHLKLREKLKNSTMALYVNHPKCNLLAWTPRTRKRRVCFLWTDILLQRQNWSVQIPLKFCHWSSNVSDFITVVFKKITAQIVYWLFLSLGLSDFPYY